MDRHQGESYYKKNMIKIIFKKVLFVRFSQMNLLNFA